MENINLQEGKSFVQQVSNSTALKLFTIAFLVLILLIPSSWIQSLITEREQRNEDTMKEISEKWSGNQLIKGPVLQIPVKTVVKTTDSKGKISYRDTESKLYLLPEQLTISGNVTPEVLHRGLFDAVVYNSNINLSGKFGNIETIKSGINPDNIVWEKAKIVSGISDLKGLKNTSKIAIGNSNYTTEPDFDTDNVFSNALAVQVNLSENKSTSVQFNYTLNLRGSGELSFLHLGKNTSLTINGSWGNPSFIGSFLPDKRDITAGNFKSSWHLSNFNRPFPQQWLGERHAMVAENESKAAFGVKFLLPVDQYQQTMRSAKYAILIILLSFVSLFFIELLKKTKINILQYVLIGAAMIIYYTLLLAMSEQIGFNLAYLIASLATITLISVFIGAFLRSSKPALAFSAILGIFYGFIYVIIQLQDFALLFGSIGLFITIASLMYFSVKINWSKLPPPVAGNS